MHDEHQRINHFLFNCMTQAEQALDGQDPGRMAEALRSILQGAWELHGWRCRHPEGALPQRGVNADLKAHSDGR
jgi:hypothetical protein